jgi:hypothetical protein
MQYEPCCVIVPEQGEIVQKEGKSIALLPQKRIPTRVNSLSTLSKFKQRMVTNNG